MIIKYVHETNVHNTIAAETIVPAILKRFKINSVVDVGSGIGTWLAVFKQNGIEDFIGIDGDYVNRDLMMIEESHFVSFDLNKAFTLNRRFDLVLCLEVAEHLEENASLQFVESLTKLGDLIIFSAAMPGQGGQNHLNEQFPEYWLGIFNSLGYELIDDLRPEFWNNQKIEWWYRQNMMLLRKNGLSNTKIELLTLIHPELYKRKLEEIHQLQVIQQSYLEGNISPLKACKLFIKSLLRSVGI